MVSSSRLVRRLIFLRTGCDAARQCAELIQIDSLHAFGFQIGINKREVAELIIGIVVDILGHIPIQDEQVIGVRGVLRPAGDFAVLDAAQFIVLLPQVRLDDLQRCQELKDSQIALGRPGVHRVRQGAARIQKPGAEQLRANRADSADRQPRAQQRAAARQAPGLLGRRRCTDTFL